MTYLDNLADDLRRDIPTDLLPNEDTGLLMRLYVLLALTKGTDVTAADVHDAWAVWMSERNPEHPSVRSFGELDAETQAEDEPFVRAIRRFAERLPSDPSRLAAHTAPGGDVAR